MSSDVIKEIKPFNLDENNWRTYKIMRKMATGYGKHNEIIDLRNYSNGANWINVNICIGISTINVSKDTNKIIASYEKIDNNSFKIISYTDNFIYSSKVDDSYSFLKKNGDTASRTDKYIGNFFYLSFFGYNIRNSSIISYYRIFKDNEWGEKIFVLNVQNNESSHKNFYLEFDEEITIEVVTSINTYKNTSSSMSFSITGGTKIAGDIIQGEAEWLAYET